jgi:hypothetical protein
MRYESGGLWIGAKPFDGIRTKDTLRIQLPRICRIIFLIIFRQLGREFPFHDSVEELFLSARKLSALLVR